MKKLLLGLVLLTGYQLRAADSQSLQNKKAGQEEEIVTLTLSDGKTEIKLSSSLAEAFTLLENILKDLGENDKAISVNNQFVTQETLDQFKAFDSELIVTVEDVLENISQYSLEQLVRLFLANNFLDFSKEFTMEDETTKQLADILFEKIIEVSIDTKDVHAVASALALLDQLPDIAKYFKTELYKRESWFCLHTLQGNGDSINSVAFSPDGQLIATALDDGTAKLWNPQTGQILHTLQAHTATVNSVAFSPDGSMIATGSSDRTAKIWNTLTGELLHTLQPDSGMIDSVAFSSNGKLFATGSWDNTTKVWDAQTGQLLRTLEGHTNWINSVAFSPDSQLVAAGSADGAVILWNTLTGQLLHTLQGHTGWISSVAFSPDGQLVATGSWDSTTKIWDAQTGQLLRTLEGHTGWVNSVEFSPDGQLIVKGSSDNAAMLFDPQTGQCLHMLQGHTGWVNSVVLSPDRSMVATGSDDGTAKIWRNKFLKAGITSLEQALQLSIQGVLYIVRTGKTAEQIKQEWEKKNDFMRSITGGTKVTGSGAKQTSLDDVD